MVCKHALVVAYSRDELRVVDLAITRDIQGCHDVISRLRVRIRPHDSREALPQLLNGDAAVAILVLQGDSSEAGSRKSSCLLRLQLLKELITVCSCRQWCL